MDNRHIATEGARIVGGSLLFGALLILSAWVATGPGYGLLFMLRDTVPIAVSALALVLGIGLPAYLVHRTLNAYGHTVIKHLRGER